MSVTPKNYLNAGKSEVNAVPLVPSGTMFRVTGIFERSVSTTTLETLVEARAYAQRLILRDRFCSTAEVYAVCKGNPTPIEVWIREEIPEINKYNAWQSYESPWFDTSFPERIKREPDAISVLDSGYKRQVVGRENGRYIFEELPRSTGTYRISQLEKS